ncbi:AEC family transporter [Candidatus Parcubacteria bacterium]|nr:AEC family transporter [Candidatus Parcubacteria bacterium]
MILEKTLPLIIIFLIGYFFKKKNILKKQDSEIFGKLLINLVIPAVIIGSFSKMTIESSLIYLPISGLIVVLTLAVAGFIFARFLKLEHKTKGVFVTTFPTLEGGTLGYAFMLSAFGELGLSRIVLFDLANAIFLFTVVYFISCRFGNDSARTKDAVVKLLKSPIIWAIFIGLAFNLIGFQNAFLSNFLDIVGGSVLVLVMLMLGLEFRPIISSFKLPAIEILLKTSIGLALGFLLTSLFNLTGVEKVAVIVGASLPPSFVTLIFSQENKLDVQYNANLLSIALPFGIIFLAVLLGFL